MRQEEPSTFCSLMTSLETNLTATDYLSACIKTNFRRIMCPDGYRCQYKVGQMTIREGKLSAFVHLE